MAADTATLTRAEKVDRYVELHALDLVVANCQAYNGVEYIEEPRGLAAFDGPLFGELGEYLDERTDELALELWPSGTDLDANSEFREASSRAACRVAEVFASLARAQEYFLDESIRFAKMGVKRDA